jgi:WD40 repeat protein/uncharacterized caspase-like protein
MIERPIGRVLLFLVILRGSVCSSQTPPRGYHEFPQLVLQSGHTSEVDHILFSRDGRLLASAAADNQVLVWNAQTGAVLRAFHLGIGALSMAFSWDNSFLAVSDYEGKLTIWNLTNGTNVRQVMGVSWIPQVASANSRNLSFHFLAFSPDSKTILCSATNGDIVLWDFVNDSISRVIPTNGHGINAIALNREGSLLAGATVSGSIALWDFKSGKIRGTLTGNKYPSVSLAFSPDGQLLASGGGKESEAGELSTWSVNTLRLVHSTIEGAIPYSYVTFLPNRELLSYTWINYPEFRDSASWAVRKRDFSFMSDLPASVAYDPNRNELAVGGMGGPCWIIDLTNSRIDMQLPPNRHKGERGPDIFNLARRPLSPGVGVSFNRDRHWLATAFNDGLYVWNLRTGIEAHRFPNQAITAMSTIQPDDSLAIGDVTGKIEIVNLKGFEITQTLSVGTSAITSLSFANEGGLVAAGDDTGHITVWKSGHSEKFTWETTKGYISISFEPRGRTIATEARDGTISLWDTTNGKLQNQEKQLGCESSGPALEWGPDGSIVAGSCGPNISLWDPSGMKSLGLLHGLGGNITSLRFTADGRSLLSTSQYGSVTDWNLASKSMIHEYQDGPLFEEGASFSPDGNWVAAVGMDGVTRIWNLNSAKLNFTLLSESGSSDWLVTNTDGWFDGSEGAWELGMWRYGANLDMVWPLEAFVATFYRPGILSDVMSGASLPLPSRRVEDLTLEEPSLDIWITPDGVDATTPLPIVNTLKKLQRAQRDDGTLTVSNRVSNVQIDFHDPLAPDSVLRGARLFRNGILVKLWRNGIQLDREGNASVSVPVTVVAGENLLTAYAFSKGDIKSQDVTLKATGDQSLARKGIVYILAIGIDSYSNQDFQLKFAGPDAQEFAKEITSTAHGWKGFSEVRALSLIDGDATKENVLAALGRLGGLVPEVPHGAPAAILSFERAAPEDSLFIFFAGHGLSSGDHYFLVPHDLGYQGKRAAIDLPGLAEVTKNSISDVEIEHAFESIDAGQMVFILDSCYSGQVLASDEQRMGPLNSYGLAHLAYEKGIYILTASQSYQAALESATFGHGLLTYSLVDRGLKESKAADSKGTITISSWLNFVSEDVPKLKAGSEDPDRMRRLVPNAEKEETQHPRVFYRREMSDNSFVIKEGR